MRDGATIHGTTYHAPSVYLGPTRRSTASHLVSRQICDKHWTSTIIYLSAATANPEAEPFARIGPNNAETPVLGQRIPLQGALGNAAVPRTQATHPNIPVTKLIGAYPYGALNIPAAAAWGFLVCKGPNSEAKRALPIMSSYGSSLGSLASL
ncbi:hypothetical protein C8Q76DRAFT_697580 [Earliella scabrosa]|nr:hypothetical protein C8Q76DRAFT_697580 [Earliella scabrosa]